jgi:hypothetical protein
VPATFGGYALLTLGTLCSAKKVPGGSGWHSATRGRSSPIIVYWVPTPYQGHPSLDQRLCLSRCYRWMPRVSGIEGQKCLPYRRNMGLLGWDANPIEGSYWGLAPPPST